MITDAEIFFRRFWKRERGPDCPYCGHQRLYTLPKRGVFSCASAKCHRQFSAAVGTPFHGSKLSFEMINKLVALIDAGLSPYAIHQKLGLQYVTAHKYARALRDSGSRRNGEDSRSEAEGEARQSGGDSRIAQLVARSKAHDQRATQIREHDLPAIRRDYREIFE